MFQFKCTDICSYCGIIKSIWLKNDSVLICQKQEFVRRNIYCASCNTVISRHFGGGLFKGLPCLSGFFLWDFPVVKIPPEWVTGPEQGKSGDRIATFSLWTGMFSNANSAIPCETGKPLWLGRYFLFCENRIYGEKVRMAVG
jgi:hypothetical protein